MTKKLFIGLMLVGFLAGCAGETLAERVEAVREKAVELCGYLPKPDSVAAMLAASNPTVVSVGAVANAICTAVIQWNSGDRSSFALTCPKVNDVCVTGEFIKPKGN